MRLFRSIFCCFLAIIILCLGLLSCQSEAPAPVSFSCRSLTWGVGGRLPEAKDFVESLPEGYTVAFAEEYSFSDLGTYTLTLVFTDARGRETEKQVQLHLVLDQEPPVIGGVADLSVCVGDGVSYRTGVTTTDNCDAPVALKIDSSAVNTSQEGSYPVIYTATDGAGNVTTVTATVYVYWQRVTEEMLWTEIDRLIELHIPTSDIAEKQIREIYRYVYDSIEYTNTSDKSDWVRAAYEGIRTGQGDCFTYFALCKAFLIRLGIETKDIQRTPGIVEERHYWNLVNIGTQDAPRWYHLDACHILGEPKPFGCLLTDAQIAAFSAQRTDANGVSGYFYAYDSASYPASDTKIITATPYD